ncbi:hypothetical protein D3C85_1111280 [compost metagenome]
MQLKSSIGPCVYGQPFDKGLRYYFEINRAVNPAEYPKIATPLGLIYRGVGRLLVDSYFEQVLGIWFYQICNIVFKAIKTALVYRASLPAINHHFGIGHRTFKNNEYLFTSYTIGKKFMFVLPLFFIFDFIVAVIIGSKALLFPVRGDCNFGPHAAFSAFSAIEIPVYGMVFIRSGEVFDNGFLRKCAETHQGTK